eukprot:maker-scaffold889_size84747-snap-gene-0.24 protein:Tk06035 transcript:maker-scaffold889_size84747-snap-gene-0.24-mRNA-1 annotation:"hypothetical protein L798_01615"
MILGLGYKHTMGKTSVLLVILVLSMAQIPGTEEVVAEITEIIGVVRLGISVVDYMHKVFSKVFQDTGVSKIDFIGKDSREMDKELLDQYYLISIALDRLAQSNEAVEITIKQLRDNMPQLIRRELKLDRVDAIVRSISNGYRTFEFYQEFADQLETHTLEDFATSATSHKEGSLRSNLEELHSLVVPQGGILGNRGIFELLANSIQVMEDLDLMWKMIEPESKEAELVKASSTPLLPDWLIENFCTNVLSEANTSSWAQPGSNWPFSGLQEYFERMQFYYQHFSNIRGHVGDDANNLHLFAYVAHNLDFVYNGIYTMDTMLASHFQPAQGLCSMEQSPHQLLYNLYNVIALTEIKGYAMLQFSYMMLQLYDKGNFTIESERVRKSFETQATNKVKAVQTILGGMNRTYWRCDPSTHREDQTFVRMTELLQGTIENEVDLNSKGSCRGTCEDFKDNSLSGCYKDRICTKQRRCTNGRLYECRFFDADANVCFSSAPGRRYDFVEYENGDVLGKAQRCSPSKQEKIESWWRMFYHCSMCVCQCDEPGPHSDRFWSLQPLVADTEANKIVTGVRFVKRNRVIQMDIEQAEALPEGSINETSREWKTSPSVDYNSADVMTMSYSNRALDTDLIEVPPGHVVTGVRLRDLDGHIRLEVQSAPIDFATGEVVVTADPPIWNENDSQVPRGSHSIRAPDIPILSHTSEIASMGGESIWFNPTDVFKDVMQTTIPYIDAQPVTTVGGSWLSGMGLYYKGSEGYGGFVGLMIQTFDFGPHMLPESTSPKKTSALRMSIETLVMEKDKRRLARLSWVVGDMDENPGRVLAQSARNLMKMAMPQTVQPPGQYESRYVVESPSHKDLAITRLQTNTQNVVNDIWKILRDPDRLTLLEGQGEGAAMAVLAMISQELKGDIFDVDQANAPHQVGQILASLQSEGKHSALGSEGEALIKIIGRVNSFYSYFQKYMDSPGQVKANTLDDFARSIIEPGSKQENTLQTALLELHNISMPHLGLVHPRKGLLGSNQRTDIYYKLFLMLNSKKHDYSCNMNQSPNQFIFNLYNVIALTEVKGYLIIQFSYMMLQLYQRGNYTLQSDITWKNFEDQTSDKLLAVQGILQNMEREFWKCDPAVHTEGTTFLQLTQLLQGIIENEVDLNLGHSCKQQCSDYTVAEVNGCYKDRICTKQRRCENGRLFDCQFFDEDAWVCISLDSKRRYEYVHYENGVVLGKGNKESFCPKQIKVDSWWRWLYHCSMCLCKCDAPGELSDRYWSLKEVTADVEENKVVTGVRFIKRDRVIHLEIEQALALPEGSIYEESREWKSPPPVDINRDIPNTDFLMMTYETRALDTDTLEAPSGHVITGIRLRSLGGHINLEAQVTPIGFTSGKLIPERATWIGNDNTPASASPREQENIYMPDISTFDHKSEILAGNNKFIQFDATSAHKDVMQTTIPFLDAQTVAPSPGTWLSAVGLYYKGTTGYGGFVGPLVRSYDFTRHLLLPENEAKGKRTF